MFDLCLITFFKKWDYAINQFWENIFNQILEDMFIWCLIGIPSKYLFFFLCFLIHFSYLFFTPFFLFFLWFLNTLYIFSMCSYTFLKGICKCFSLSQIYFVLKFVKEIMKTSMKNMIIRFVKWRWMKNVI